MLSDSGSGKGGQVIVALDAHYREDSSGRAAAIVFHDWDDEEPAAEHIVEFTGVAFYKPGAFYERELPGLLEVIEKVGERPDIIIVDGYAWLAEDNPGLGAQLWKALKRRIPVIGVAKSEFRGAPAVELVRGKSWRPIYVTAAGMDTEQAARAIESMAGDHRIPLMLQRVDRLARTRGL